MRHARLPLAALATTATLLVALACRSTAAPAPAPRDETTLRVMTFNIAAGNGSLARIAETIGEANVDIAGLQEVDVRWSERSRFVDQADSLARLLGMEVRFAPIYRIPNADPSKPPREFGVALLSRHPVARFTNHPITRHSTLTPNAPPAPMPGLLDATVTLRGTAVRVLVTHLDYRADPTVRATQVQETLRIVEEGTQVPTLLVGDLNAPPAAPELAALRARFRDAWDADTGGLSYPAAAPAKRIDYLLYAGRMRVRSARVLTALASDHRPIVAEFALTTR